MVSVLPRWPSHQLCRGAHILLVPRVWSWSRPGAEWGSEPLTLPREQNTGTRGQLSPASAEGVQGLFVFHFKPRVFLFN